MNAREELVRRLSIKRSRKLGTLSDEAFAELELAVRKDPMHFVDDDAEQAFALVGQAIARYEESRHDDDLLDDEHYVREREHRFERMQHACKQALALDPSCVDASLLAILAQDTPVDVTMGLLVELENRINADEGTLQAGAAGDAWTDVWARPRLRVMDAIARTCLCSARYGMARERSLDLLSIAPLDALGARLTCALAMARLEDEEGFMWLVARESGHDNAWFHLSRTILMYKLGRMPAARRALRGYDELCQGGAYALLQPIYVDVYMPDRPSFVPGAFDEAILAVHEADPIVSDIPDFAAWTCDQPGFLASAQEWCRRNGMDWRDWE